MVTVDERKREAAEKAEALRRDRAAIAAAAKAGKRASPIIAPDDDGIPLAIAETALRSERETLADLVSKRSEADAADSTLSAERERIAYAAHTGDAAAADRLAQIHVEAATAASEKAALDAAISEAKRRLAGAEADRQAAAEAQRARQVLALLAEFRDHGGILDAATRHLVACYGEFEEICRSIRALGAGNFTEQAIRVNCRRALSSSLMNTDLQQEMVVPLQRHSFAELVEQWATGIEHWATARLPSNDREAA